MTKVDMILEMAWRVPTDGADKEMSGLYRLATAIDGTALLTLADSQTNPDNYPENPANDERVSPR